MPLLLRPYRLNGPIMRGPVAIDPLVPLQTGFIDFNPPAPGSGILAVPPKIPTTWGSQPPAPPIVMPASIPTSNGQTPVTALSTLPSPGATVVVSPTNGPIPPPNTPIIPAGSGNPLMDFLTGSLFGGIPNWVLVGGALLLLGGNK